MLIYLFVYMYLLFTSCKYLLQNQKVRLLRLFVQPLTIRRDVIRQLQFLRPPREAPPAHDQLKNEIKYAVIVLLKGSKVQRFTACA